jgi:phosphoglycolate phosphatase
MNSPNNQYTNTPITQKSVILFDLDGTLIDSTEAILDSFRESFAEMGGSYPGDEAVKALVGHPLTEMYRSYGVPEERVATYVDCYKRHYRQVHTLKTLLLPGAREAVELAASFARLGVVTTKTGKYSRELLEHFGLMERFEVLIGSEDVTRHKPHPEPLQVALKRMETGPERAWMIGDTCLDMEAARAAGVRPAGVCCGYGSEAALRQCGAWIFPDTLSAVKKIRTVLQNRGEAPQHKALLSSEDYNSFNFQK